MTARLRQRRTSRPDSSPSPSPPVMPTNADLQAQLDAALVRIKELEKELAHVLAQNAESNQSSNSPTKVLTRSAAAALASKSDDLQESRSLTDSQPSTTVRARYKASHRNSTRNGLPTSTKSPHTAAHPSEGGDGRALRAIQPAPSTLITGQQQFVPLQLKLPPSATQAQIAAKLTSVNILSASSSLSDLPSPQSPSLSTNSKKKSTSAPKLPLPKRSVSVQSGISKSRKDKSGLVAKCTEPRPGQTRYWTEMEHERFLEAIAQYGEKAYVAISNYVETRTPKQVRTHAQKFQMKVARLARERAEAGEMMELPAGMLPNSIGIDPSKVSFTPPANATPMQVEAAARAASENEARRRAKELEAEREEQARACTMAQEGAKEEEVLAETHGNMDSETTSDVEGRSSADEDAVDPFGGNSSANTCNPHVAHLLEAVSCVSDVSSDGLAADPYLSYIGGEAVQDGAVAAEFDFAPKLSGLRARDDALMDDSVVRGDDDLEELDDCGDLPMASLINFGI